MVQLIFFFLKKKNINNDRNFYYDHDFFNDQKFLLYDMKIKGC